MSKLTITFAALLFALPALAQVAKEVAKESKLAPEAGAILDPLGAKHEASGDKFKIVLPGENAYPPIEASETGEPLYVRDYEALSRMQVDKLKETGGLSRDAIKPLPLPKASANEYIKFAAVAVDLADGIIYAGQLRPLTAAQVEEALIHLDRALRYRAAAIENVRGK